MFKLLSKHVASGPKKRGAAHRSGNREATNAPKYIGSGGLEVVFANQFS